MKLFGFNIERDRKPDLPALSFPENQEGAIEATSAGGAFASYIDLEAVAKTDADLIMKYREMAEHPECDMAIENIIQEAIITNQNRNPVDLDLTHTELSKNLQDRISEEFEIVLKLLDFNNQAYDIFKRWYIEGRVIYHVMIDPKQDDKGIQELRLIDSFKIKKVRQIIPDTKATPAVFKLPKFEEYYLFNEKGLLTPSQMGVKVAPDSIIMAHSGIMTKDKKFVVSHLHKAIKALNQLRMLEDAVVIYRIARAPERRIFYIDVGNLPKQKAEQYLKDIMTRYKNKLVYDASSGEIKDDRRHQSMLEDYWLPRREGGRGTEITTLPGGQNLGEIEDIIYFRNKLYRSLNIPVSRLEEGSTGFSLGRSAEITRDEVKFTKFVQKLRRKFNTLFNDLLKTQLILKGVIAEEDWPSIRDNISFQYLKDGHYAEMRDMDLLRDRLDILNTIEPYIGEWFSKEYVRKHVFRMTEDEIKAMDDQIEDEPDPEPVDPAAKVPGTGGAAPPAGGEPPPEGGEEEPPPEEEEIQIDSKKR